MGYDIKQQKTIQLFLNDKFLCVIDGFEYEEHALVENKKTTVLRLTKKDKVQFEEANKQRKDMAENTYDKFFQDMVKKIKNPKYHLPI